MKLKKSIAFQLIVIGRVVFGAVCSACFFLITCIHLAVGESGGYLSRRFAARQISATKWFRLLEAESTKKQGMTPAHCPGETVVPIRMLMRPYHRACALNFVSTLLFSLFYSQQ